MKQEYKLYAAGGLVLILGIAVYVVSTGEQKASDARSGSTEAKNVPTVKLAKEEAEKVTRFVIKNKDKDEVTLEKKGDKWEIVKPMSAAANEASIKSIVENLEKIEIDTEIASTKDVHEKYELTDGKAVHVQAFQGDKSVLDMYFGKATSRVTGGTIARMGGQGATDAVYAVKGYSSYLWGKDAKGWRHNEILKFEDANVVATEIENENGRFSFTLADDKWTGKHYPRDAEGKLAAEGVDIDKFDENKVKDLLRAYKNLKSTDFAEAGADAGTDDAVKNGGGVIKFTLKDESEPKYVIKVGKKQEGSNRFLVKDGDATVYIVSSWAADWATAKPEKFAKTEEKGEGEGEGDEHVDEDVDEDTDAKDKDAKDDKSKDKDAKDKDKGKDAKKDEKKKEEPKKVDKPKEGPAKAPEAPKP